MSALTIDTSDAARVAGSLEAIAAALADPADLLADVGGQVARMAAGNTPRATGALAASATTAAGQLEGHPAQLLTWGARYAVYVNFGTRYMAARPFATDALTAAAGTAETTMRTWAEHALTQT